MSPETMKEPSIQEKTPHEKLIHSSEDPEKVIEGTIEDYEVFKQTTDGVDFRTVGWPRASVIFLKVNIPCSYDDHC